MSHELIKDGVDRRTILKGAAWSAPVLGAALAAPLAASSDPVEPECNNCLQPGLLPFEKPSIPLIDTILSGLGFGDILGTSGGWVMASILDLGGLFGNKADFFLAGGFGFESWLCFDLLSSALQLQPVNSIIIESVELTMDDNKTYTAQTPGLIPGGLGVEGGVGVIPSLWTFKNIEFRTGIFNFVYRKPTKLKINLAFDIKWGLGVSDNKRCTSSLEWNLGSPLPIVGVGGIAMATAGTAHEIKQ